jgi:hypothetical protein
MPADDQFALVSGMNDSKADAPRPNDTTKEI